MIPGQVFALRHGRLVVLAIQHKPAPPVVVGLYVADGVSDRHRILLSEWPKLGARYLGNVATEETATLARRVMALEDAGSIATVNTAHLNAKEST